MADSKNFEIKVKMVVDDGGNKLLKLVGAQNEQLDVQKSIQNTLNTAQNKFNKLKEDSIRLAGLSNNAALQGQKAILQEAQNILTTYNQTEKIVKKLNNDLKDQALAEEVATLAATRFNAQLAKSLELVKQFQEAYRVTLNQSSGVFSNTSQLSAFNSNLLTQRNVLNMAANPAELSLAAARNDFARHIQETKNANDTIKILKELSNADLVKIETSLQQKLKQIEEDSVAGRLKSINAYNAARIAAYQHAETAIINNFIAFENLLQEENRKIKLTDTLKTSTADSSAYLQEVKNELAQKLQITLAAESEFARIQRNIKEQSIQIEKTRAAELLALEKLIAEGVIAEEKDLQNRRVAIEAKNKAELRNLYKQSVNDIIAEQNRLRAEEEKFHRVKIQDTKLQNELAAFKTVEAQRLQLITQTETAVEAETRRFNTALTQLEQTYATERAAIQRQIDQKLLTDENAINTARLNLAQKFERDYLNLQRNLETALLTQATVNTRAQKFKDGLKNQEQSLQASIERQKAIFIHGENSLQVARIDAAQKAVKIEQTRAKEIARIEKEINENRLTASKALNQLKIANSTYKDEINKINEALADHERRSASVRREHQSLAVRVLELIGIYRVYNTVFNSVSSGIRGIPTVGIEFESTLASLTSTVEIGAKTTGVLRALTEEAERTGIRITTLRENFRTFQASTSLAGETLTDTWRIFTNLNTVVTSLHLSADKAKGIFNALAQIFNKSKVQSEELVKQLGNLIPGAFASFATAMGIAPQKLSEAMKKGLVFAHENVLKFSEFLATRFSAGFELANKGFNAQLGRLSTSFEELQKTLYLATVEGMTKFVVGLTEVIKATDHWIQTTKNLGFLLTAIKNTILVIVGISLGKWVAKSFAVLIIMAATAGGVLTAGVLTPLQKIPYALKGITTGLAAFATSPVVIAAAFAALAYSLRDWAKNQTDELAKAKEVLFDYVTKINEADSIALGKREVKKIIPVELRFDPNDDPGVKELTKTFETLKQNSKRSLTGALAALISGVWEKPLAKIQKEYLTSVQKNLELLNLVTIAKERQLQITRDQMELDQVAYELNVNQSKLDFAELARQENIRRRQNSSDPNIAANAQAEQVLYGGQNELVQAQQEVTIVLETINRITEEIKKINALIESTSTEAVRKSFQESLEREQLKLQGYEDRIKTLNSFIADRQANADFARQQALQKNLQREEDLHEVHGQNLKNLIDEQNEIISSQKEAIATVVKTIDTELQNSEISITSYAKKIKDSLTITKNDFGAFFNDNIALLQSMQKKLNEDLAKTTMSSQASPIKQELEKVETQLRELKQKRERFEKDISQIEEETNQKVYEANKNVLDVVIDVNMEYARLTGNLRELAKLEEARDARNKKFLENNIDKPGVPEALQNADKNKAIKDAMIELQLIEKATNNIYAEREKKLLDIAILAKENKITAWEELLQQENLTDETKKQLQIQIEKAKAVLDLLRTKNITPPDDLLKFVDDLTTRYKNLSLEVTSIGEKISKSLSDNFANAFSNFITGTETAAEAFRSFATAIIQEMARMAAQQAASQISGLLQLAFTAASSALGFGTTTSEKGNIVNSGNIIPFVRGGIPDVGNGKQYFPLRNGGTGSLRENNKYEAIVPLKRNAQGELGISADGMTNGGNVYNISVTVTKGTNETADETGTKIAESIIRSLAKQEIDKAARPGGRMNKTNLYKVG